jgi:UDP-2-acetamido-2,6-beta-L-arabino-hexul-4-ose reductase
MTLLVTGSEGFIGKNLLVRLSESSIKYVCFNKQNSVDELPALLKDVDFVFHLAGVNRPEDPAEFYEGNCGLTSLLCKAIQDSGRAIPVVFTSSIQAETDNDYGLSKRAAEDALIKLNAATNSPVYLYRLPNIFGKWARPNYNSAVATFCHNSSQDLPIRIDDPNKAILLTYIDDLVDEFIRAIKTPHQGGVTRPLVEPIYSITVGGLAAQIETFKEGRTTLMTEDVGVGLVRALYATYLSYLKPVQFAYEIPSYQDERGRFIEMLKTKEAGQFSFFTAHLGVTRGGHYHHTKSEKFLVLQGRARYSFRHIITNETYELMADSTFPKIIETIPGWTHDITNIGENELIVMLWASEAFDRSVPDTIPCKV